jgi:adenosylcobinamide kinase/adenosylcobinamide-phosphate guanylyltransferase
VGHITLVTGGARSGKSSRAEALVRALEGARFYIATSRVYDAEMAEKIAQHVEQRGAGWETVEEPLDLVGALDRTDGHGARLVDCLTLWLSNLMIDDLDWEEPCARLIAALGAQRSPVVMVSNEVGMGIVPDNRLGRRFRDAQGWLNQRVAQVADSVEFVVAGIPMKLK